MHPLHSSRPLSGITFYAAFCITASVAMPAHPAHSDTHSLGFDISHVRSATLENGDSGVTRLQSNAHRGVPRAFSGHTHGHLEAAAATRTVGTPGARPPFRAVRFADSDRVGEMQRSIQPGDARRPGTSDSCVAAGVPWHVTEYAPCQPVQGGLWLPQPVRGSFHIAHHSAMSQPFPA